MDLDDDTTRWRKIEDEIVRQREIMGALADAAVDEDWLRVKALLGPYMRRIRYPRTSDVPSGIIYTSPPESTTRKDEIACFCIITCVFLICLAGVIIVWRLT